VPRIRVVIPTYNRAVPVCAALRSVQAQTFTDFDVVVADDGSADETVHCVEAMARQDPKISLIALDHGGAAKARNAGVEAPGSFEAVAFLDADDLWTPTHLQEAVEILDQRRDIALVYGRFETIDHTGTWTPEEFAARERRISNAARLNGRAGNRGVHILERDVLMSAFVRNDTFPLTSTTVIRTSVVDRTPWFDPTFLFMEDGDLFLRLVATGRPWAFIERSQATAHFFGDNLTRARDLSSPVTLGRLRSQLRFSALKLLHAESSGDRQVVRREIAEVAYLVGQCCTEQSRCADACAAYLQSLKAHPSSLAAKGLAAACLPTTLANVLRRIRTLACAPSAP
jgi:GT2 family glycosyltransferase